MLHDSELKNEFMFLWWAGVWPFRSVGPGPSCTMCWSLMRARRKRKASYSGMTSGSLKPWNNWNWSISRFPVFFYISHFPSYLILLQRSFYSPPHFLFYLQFLLWSLQECSDKSWTSLLTLIYCSPLAVFCGCCFFLGRCAIRGCKVDTKGHECRCGKHKAKFCWD